MEWSTAQQNVFIFQSNLYRSKRVDKLTCFLDGDTRCETAYLTIKCYQELMPEVKILLYVRIILRFTETHFL